MAFKDNFKELRKANNLTQAELAKKLNLVSMSISRYESGTNEPSLETLINIAKLFSVSTDTLLDYKETSKNETGYSKIMDLYSLLNKEGQERLIEQAEMLLNSGKYKKHNKSKMVSGEE